MRLNAVSIDPFGSNLGIRWTSIHDRINVIDSQNRVALSGLRDCMRQILFSGLGGARGQLDVSLAGKLVRLRRNSDAPSQLDVAVIGSNGLVQRNQSIALRELQEIDVSGFDAAFFVTGSSLTVMTENLLRYMNRILPPNRFSDNDWQTSANRQSDQLLFNELTRQKNRLEDERNNLSRQIENANSETKIRQLELDGQIAATRHELATCDTGSIRRQIDTMDREITDLRLQIESAAERVEYVSRPNRLHDSLPILYRRLDEIDSQIRRWRRVHSDVQSQRVKLKEEMEVWAELTVDSMDHPYHRSRELLQEIESKLILAESSAGELRSQPLNDTRRPHVAEQLVGLCGMIRRGLYSLRDELGSQYKNVRHRCAAAELKRLRRCYHEIGENIDALLENRRSLIDEIGHFDPAGSAAILRADNDLYQVAQREGYWQARRRLFGEMDSTPNLEVVRNDVSSETVQLRDLENQRLALVRDLVQRENRSTELHAQLDRLLAEREQSVNHDLHHLQARLHQLVGELNSVSLERRDVSARLNQPHEPVREVADPTVQFASQIAARLSRGQFRRIQISRQQPSGGWHSIQVEDALANVRSWTQLDQRSQQVLLLALRLAVVEHFRRRGIVVPMFVELQSSEHDLSSAEEWLAVLDEYSSAGTQIFVFTDIRFVCDFALRNGWSVLDMPETSIYPVVPTWTPERLPMEIPREPEFLTPFTTRRANSPSDIPKLYPQVKYPETGHYIDHSAAHFDQSPFHADELESRIGPRIDIDLKMDLRSLNYLDSSQIQRLAQTEITTLAQLLERNPRDHRGNAIVCESELDYWQSLVWLLLCVPELNPRDAEILIALGISEPELLENTHHQQLLDRIQRYLNTPEGRRLNVSASRYSRETVNRWYDALGQTRARWRTSSGYSRRNRWLEPASSTKTTRETRPAREAPAPADHAVIRSTNRDDHGKHEFARFEASDRQSSSSRNDRQPPVRSLAMEPAQSKFYLNSGDLLEAAPSIGPKTADRFLQIGVRTVGEFLTQTAESMASKINYKRITADVIRQWQHQSRLVCRIPNLRGHDAQLLVACGIIEPEDLSRFSAEQLLAKVKPFANSKEGLKITRGGNPPDLEEVQRWISWSKQTRSFQAA